MFEQIRNAVREWRELGIGKKLLWQNARMVFIEVPVDASAVREWVPWPLLLASPARATVFIGDYPETTFAPHYQEAAMLLHVRLFGILPAVYCPWIVLNNDRALILGREMLGFPKKMADVSFTEKRGQFTGSVTRNGVELLRITGKVGRKVADPLPGLGQRIINLRGMLNMLVPSHLLMFHPHETVHNCHALTGTRVTMRSSEDDPLGVAAGSAEHATIRTCDVGAGPLPLRVFPVHALFSAHLMKLRVR